MTQQSQKRRVIKSDSKRYILYIAGAVLAAALIVATLVQVDQLDLATVDEWMKLVLKLVGEIWLFGSSILAALNIDWLGDGEPGDHAAE